MIKELKDKLEVLANLLEHELKGKEELLRNASEHYKYYADAAMEWEHEREAAAQKHEENKTKAEKAKAFLDKLSQK